MMYTIEDTVNEITTESLSKRGSARRWASKDRDAFVWISFAEKHGVDFEMNCVRFFEQGEWVDTWYPINRATAERLAKDWVNGSSEVKDRIAEALA